MDTSYPDNLPPEVGIPAMLIILAFYGVSVVKERRAALKGSK